MDVFTLSAALRTDHQQNSKIDQCFDMGTVYFGNNSEAVLGCTHIGQM
eukprot:XP_001708240.1 Hypothetical protein GL50803_38337 [Giardia lamblia ATCC 50803]